MRAMQHYATLHRVTTLDAVTGSARPNSCGVRTHALTDYVAQGALDHSAKLPCCPGIPARV